jgi:hypothetical protein
MFAAKGVNCGLFARLHIGRVSVTTLPTKSWRAHSAGGTADIKGFRGAVGGGAGLGPSRRASSDGCAGAVDAIAPGIPSTIISILMGFPVAIRSW